MKMLTKISISYKHRKLCSTHLQILNELRDTKVKNKK